MEPRRRIQIHDHSDFNSGGLVAAHTIVRAAGVPSDPTITPGAGGGGDLAVLDEGILVGSDVTSIDVVGAAVVASGSGSAATVTVSAELPIEGGQSAIKAHGSMGSTETFDPTDGNVHTGTLNANCTFTLSAPSGTGACTLELRLTQDGTGGWAITWPGSVTVIGTLVTTASTQSIVIVETLDGGTSWVAVVVGASSASFATPAIVLGSSAAAGAATTVIRSDATIAAFDATVPVTQAFGDTAATGSAAFAARRDHKHGMPATPTSGQHILLADGHATPFAFTDLLQMDDGSDFMWSDP